ncbi:MFS transporter [Sphingobium sp.]|uniref:MFS transporter n=1 Tax=Sphingobium sp. TaxID=1912891 RepID=UPI0028BEA38E|nr:MFS transporter [Sphingobium sp.]
MVSTVAGEPRAPGSEWTRLQLSVVLICSIINALDGMDVLIVSFIAPSLARDWSVSMEGLGIIFSAGLAGMMAGSMLLAPLADIFGRRPMILVGLILITVAMIASGLVATPVAFALTRVIAGLGIGTLLASVAAMTSEFAPPDHRTFAIGIFQGGYPFGAVATGFAAIWAIPHYGWQATLIAAGVISGLLLPVVFALLPESPDYLERRQPANALPRLNRIRAQMRLAPFECLPSIEAAARKVRFSRFFERGMWKPTLQLWTSTFLGVGVLYFVLSWIPKLAVEAGLAPEDALYAGTLLNLGGFAGSLTLGWMARRLPVGWLICAFLTASTVFMIIFSLPGTSLPLALVLAMLIGFALQGGFSAFYSLSAMLYPTAIRSSGIGWATGWGRFGAVFGPLIGGYLLSQGHSLLFVFLCYAVPLLISGVLAGLVRRPARHHDG